ncbi:ATPase family associated with various cellular activities (AAA) [Selenomonas ruminantium]|uniref:ATPase family associated with various cellular activities (AAA) n=1 Tax=Selenomonas ruminantium TaxID=971 RepID=A0A1I3E0P8_SELRU|nr:AAA family ATPase [Selenomonas ruminantium]SFH92261.1 ATPase family associated with various cellular activities (AAA) [Selenomonas ruminantium]
MLFYKLKVACNLIESGKLHTAYNESRNSWVSELEELNDTLASTGQENKIFLTLYKATKDELSLVAILDTLDPRNKKKVLAYFTSCISEEKYGLSLSNPQFKEITPSEAKKLLDSSSQILNHYFRRNDVGYDLDYYNNGSFKIIENLLDHKPMSQKQAIQKAQSLMADETLLDELERIYSPKHPQKFQGHPIHYKLSVGNSAEAMQLSTFLAHALYVNKRLVSRCISRIYEIDEHCYNDSDIECIFRQSVGGTVIIELSGSREEHQNYTTCYEEVVNFFAENIRKYQCNTLFILVENTKNPGFTHNLVTDLQDDMFFVEIKEGTGNHQEATDYLKQLLDAGKLSYSTEQIRRALGEKTTFRPSDIHKIYDGLYRDNLRNNMYTAYKTVSRVKLIKKTNPPQDAYSRLQSMVGLHEVKSIVDDILNTFRAHKLRSTLGLSQYRPNMHMVFTGNPGSAKTTVARLLADILNKEGILTSGEFVECGRADLVGKYVGWTAPQIKKMFRAAQGGVLFIDEAYSLVDDRDGSFGDEAINTIVQEMENHRDDTIVVFAGYPDKMERFLEKNEGLRSRISFHIDFPNYNPQELVEILHHMADRQELKLSPDIDESCREIFNKASQQENFGNGRFVRNLLEQAQIRQSSRIMQEYDGKEIDRNILLQLETSDFDVPLSKQSKNKSRSVGFIT